MTNVEDIARDFGLTITGPAHSEIGQPAPLTEAVPGSLTWLKSLTEEHLDRADDVRGAVVVTPAASNADEQRGLERLAERNTVLQAPVGTSPRLLFARILARYFSNLQVEIPPGIDPTARIHPTAEIGRDVTIATFCFIGPHVTIGDGTVLHPGVVIHSRTRIGRNCILNANVVVGNRGFGFVRDADGTLVHFPHVGRVVIEDEVEIQANTVVDRDALGETRVGRGTKVDNLCHIGHGARIGPNCTIAACAEIGARAVLEEGTRIGPHSCSLEDTSFGRGAFVGIGSTVIRSVPEGAVVAGSPAEPIEILRRKRQAISALAGTEP